MNAQAIPADESTAVKLETENDRFKKSFGSWFWGSMIAATVVHFMLFQFWPTQTAADVSFSAEELEMIELPPEIEIPPPPEAISRPATPVMATADIDDDITIAPTTFADNPVEDLPPPPTDDGVAGYRSGSSIHTDDCPAGDHETGSEVQAALMREYPAILRDAGIGGTVVVWFFITEEGLSLRTVENFSERRVSFSLIKRPSRSRTYVRFTPALNRDQRVQVWIEVPITFQVL